MAVDLEAYRRFVADKVLLVADGGLPVELEEVNPLLKPHQRDGVVWGVRKGKGALFESFGLGKTLQQLEIVRLVLKKIGSGRGLIVAPLGVRQEFKRDAEKLGISVTFVRRTREVGGDGIYLTNYESVRDGRLDPSLFQVASLDEAACLRGFGGTKTFREFMRLFEGRGPQYKYVATATPAPNEFIELLAYSAFLEVGDVGQIKTRFFKRDSTKADKLTLHPHKEREFWLWLSTWALFLQRPSDLGYPDTGYELPPLDIRWHEVPTDHARAVPHSRTGQARLFKNASMGVREASSEKRESLDARLRKLLEIRAEDPLAHRLIWHDLEDERRAIERACPGVVSVYGSQDLEIREQAIVDFSDGKIRELAAKPVLAGSGCNFQRYCSHAIFLGIGFKFADFIQAIHRIQRFLQERPVRIDLIYTEAERGIRRVLEAKWRRHEELVQKMTDIIRTYKLSQAAVAATLTRSLGVERVEARGRNFRLVNNDAVEEMATVASDSVHLHLTSIPFSFQYEYTPNFNDFGHTDSNEHFWRQMDFLTPELYRTLQPGRIAAIHVKDRIVPGGVNGLGFQTLHPFSDECVAHFQKHGFAYLGKKSIITDVVRENNQTYRLGWTEQCKDGSRMGCGVPEYLLIFRKPPSDLSNGYADVPVVKDKPLCDDGGEPAPFDSRTNWRHPVPGTGYSRARWQFDAHGFERSSGDRLLSSDEIVNLPHAAIYKLWRDRSMLTVYDHEGHVRLAEELDYMEKLPAGFMLIPPHSWHPDVWSDVARMRTLNMEQERKGQEMHLCPLQFDIVDRAIRQYTMEGETVCDCFAGIMTVPVRAIRMKRKALAVELNPRYFLDGTAYCEAEAQKASTPTLFDFLKEEAEMGEETVE